MRYDLGTIPGKNRPAPSDILHANRAENWRDFTALLLAANLAFIVFAVWGWR